ncbi:MAG TPA: DUF4258 domain-containing protein [Ktedonobacterales bacterium]|nr:DUF4258 domain-containing protein [Ktedonobacterales bacterium]
MTIEMRACSGRCTASTSAWGAQPEPRLTGHALQRAARRNLTLDAVRYVITYGREFHRTGVTFFVLRRRDIPREDLRLPWVARLEGVAALVASDGAVITLYRNPAAARAIVRKLKYRLPWKTARRRGEAPEEG